MVGHLEAAGLGFVGSGEGSCVVAEELAFEKLGGKGGAVEAAVTLLRAGGVLVQQAGDDVLADAAFAE